MDDPDAILDDEEVASLRREAEVSSDVFVADVMWSYAHLDDDTVTSSTSPRLSAWTVWNWARNPKNLDKFLTALMPKALSIQEARAAKSAVGQERVDPELSIDEVSRLLRKVAPGKPDLYEAIKILRRTMDKPRREAIVNALKALGAHVKGGDGETHAPNPSVQLYREDRTVGLLPPTRPV